MQALKAEYARRGTVPQDVIEAVPFELPPLAPGQVRLEMLAAPINPSDVLTLTGQYGILPPLPAVGGNEGVAQVIEHGPGVSAPALGSVVLLPVGIGTWASHMNAEADKLMVLPEGVDPVQLSMISINPPTAALMLSEFVDLAPGDWIIQNAANSGVGAAVIAIAKHRGLKTVNLVRRESLVQPLLDAGADVVLVDTDNSTSETNTDTLAERVRAATQGAPIRLGIDAVGGDATRRLGEALSEKATLVNYGAMSGEPSVLSAQLLIFKQITVRGFWLAKWFQSATPEQIQEVFGTVTTLIAQQKLISPVHATYPLTDIKTAVETAAQGQRDGKVVLVSENLN